MAQIEDYLEQIEDVLDTGRSIPFSDKVGVDADEIRDILDDIRSQLPAEITQAKSITLEKESILSRAKTAADILLDDARN